MIHLRNFTLYFAVVLAIAACALPAGTSKADGPATSLATLDTGHPRLFLEDAELNRLKETAKTDPVLRSYVDQVIKDADGFLDKPQLEHKLVGPRLLSVSRACLDRVQTLALAYRWTGDEKYAKKAEENLLTVCAFEDWNPSHFLDTAEMSNAVGLGYDWLYAWLSPESQKKIKAGLIRNGMKPGLEAYAEKHWFTASEFNWNQVCNGGLLVGALAIADTDPKYAKVIVPAAVASLPGALRSYGPDGVWMEGPGYWHYATSYTAYGLAALQTALGTDFGLSSIDGLSVTGRFPLYCTGPAGLYLNFADSRERARAHPGACMFWLADQYDDPFLAAVEHDLIAASPKQIDPFHVVWYVPAPQTPPDPPPLDHVFRSPVEIAVFRSAWNDPEALFVGVKSGYNQVNHGHLDLGNFELDALGVRWSRDLGSDNYNLPGYWDKKKGGDRWKIYRMRSVSHSVPILSGRDQDEEATARFIKSRADGADPFVIVDLTSAYKNFAKRSQRGVRLVDNRRAVLVQDEFDVEEPCSVTWAMTTDALINVRNDGSAELTIDGRKLVARLLSPPVLQFTQESAQQEPPERANEGVRRLKVDLPRAMGRVRVAVLLEPVWEDGQTLEPPKVRSLDSW